MKVHSWTALHQIKYWQQQPFIYTFYTMIENVTKENIVCSFIG